MVYYTLYLISSTSYFIQPNAFVYRWTFSKQIPYKRIKELNLFFKIIFKKSLNQNLYTTFIQ